MQEKALVSIVVPVYNVERYISKCLCSLKNQTYKNIEIIIIDDGSTDNSKQKIDIFLNDERFKYFYQNNSGLGGARNTGVENANGKYLLFLDSDDWLRSDAIDLLVDFMEINQCDLGIFNMEYVYDDGTINKNTPQITSCEILDKKKAIKEELLGNKYKFHAPNKIIKSSILKSKDIKFPVGKFYEDIATTYRFILCSTRVGLLPESLYFYRQKRSGSITSIINKKQLIDLLDSLNCVIADKEIKSFNIREALQTMYVENIIGITNFLWRMKNKGDDEWKELYKMMTSDRNWNYLDYLIFNKTLKLSAKIRGFLIKNNIELYFTLLSHVKKRGKYGFKNK